MLVELPFFQKGQLEYTAKVKKTKGEEEEEEEEEDEEKRREEKSREEEEEEEEEEEVHLYYLCMRLTILAGGSGDLHYE